MTFKTIGEKNMSEIYEEGYAAGIESNDDLRPDETIAFQDEYMAGFAYARAYKKFEKNIAPGSFAFLLGESAGFHSVPRSLFDDRYNYADDAFFDAGHQEGCERRQKLADKFS